MELWDILDEHGNKTGKLAERGNPLRRDEYHLVVEVWIKNDSNQYLITKRTLNKMLPGMWETTTGSAITGDDSLTAALREVKEEIGLELKSGKGRLLFRIKKEDQFCSHFKDIWLFNANFDVSEIICQPEEVSEARWVSKDEIFKMIDENKFANTYDYLDEVFNAR